MKETNNMQTRIEITITDEERHKLYDKQLKAMEEIESMLEGLPFPATVQVFDNEPV